MEGIMVTVNKEQFYTYINDKDIVSHNATRWGYSEYKHRYGAVIGKILTKIEGPKIMNTYFLTEKALKTISKS
jgi:hypothetical protein